MTNNTPWLAWTLILMAILVVITVILINQPSIAGNVVYDVENINACRALAESGKSYILTQDLSSQMTCFSFDADNIMLDCAGHKITGNGNGYGASVLFRKGIVIKNCNFANFSRGIYLESSTENFITDNTLSFNSQYGVYLVSSTYNTITKNLLTSNKLDGIYLVQSLNNTVEDNLMNEEKVIVSNVPEPQVQIIEEAKETTGFFGNAVNFAKTSSGISFILMVLVAGVIIAAVLSRAPEPSKSYSQLDRFLILAISKKHKPETIKRALIARGWKKSFIDTYYSDFVEKLRQQKRK